MMTSVKNLALIKSSTYLSEKWKKKNPKQLRQEPWEWLKSQRMSINVKNTVWSFLVIRLVLNWNSYTHYFISFHLHQSQTADKAACQDNIGLQRLTQGHFSEHTTRGGDQSADLLLRSGFTQALLSVLKATASKLQSSHGREHRNKTWEVDLGVTM